MNFIAGNADLNKQQLIKQIFDKFTERNLLQLSLTPNVVDGALSVSAAPKKGRLAKLADKFR